MFEQIKDVKNILVAYKNDMDRFQKFAIEHNYLTPNIDTWYHTSAMYDAAKGDPGRALAALVAGAIKEVRDIPKYTKDKGLAYALRESKKDMKNNIQGILWSFETPEIKAQENDKINNLQTPTMRDIMPLYRALNESN